MSACVKCVCSLACSWAGVAPPPVGSHHNCWVPGCTLTAIIMSGNKFRRVSFATAGACGSRSRDRPPSTEPGTIVVRYEPPQAFQSAASCQPEEEEDDTFAFTETFSTFLKATTFILFRHQILAVQWLQTSSVYSIHG